MRAGNEPSRIVLNARQGSDTSKQTHPALYRMPPPEESRDAVVYTGMTTRVQTFYTDLTVLMEAVKEVSRRMIRMTRSKSGMAGALGHYYYWCEDFRQKSRSRKIDGILNVAAVQRWIAGSSSIEIRVDLIGPTLEYRRSIIYNPNKMKGNWVDTRNVYRHAGRIGGRGLERGERAAYRRAFRGTHNGLRSANPIQYLVVQAVQRNYKDIRFTYLYLRSKENLPIRDTDWSPSRGKNKNVPLISMKIKNESNRGRW